VLHSLLRAETPFDTHFYYFKWNSISQAFEPQVSLAFRCLRALLWKLS